MLEALHHAHKVVLPLGPCQKPGKHPPSQRPASMGWRGQMVLGTFLPKQDKLQVLLMLESHQFLQLKDLDKEQLSFQWQKHGRLYLLQNNALFMMMMMIEGAATNALFKML